MTNIQYISVLNVGMNYMDLIYESDTYGSDICAFNICEPDICGFV